MLLFSPDGNTAEPQAPRAKSFEELRDEGLRALETGRLAESLALFEQALSLAKAREDENLIDLATCNRSTALIPLGRSREIMPELRQILVRNPDPTICSFAAYNLSRAHETNKEYKKGLFYGRIARDRALAADRQDLLVGSYNLIGNCLMSDSFFAEAAKEYRRGLSLVRDEPSKQRAMVMANLGYCLMMLDKLRPGMQLSFTALRWFRRHGILFYEVWPHLDLCYAYIELGRYRRAREHGLAALALTRKTGEVDCGKAALFLLGETERMAGDLGAALEYFSILQEHYYADVPEVAMLMAQLGLRHVVNLRA